MNRRQFLSSVAGSLAVSMLSESLCSAAVPTAKLGLADFALGEGLIDLKQVVSILRQKDPEIPFVLDTSVRDPLKVPCLTPKYWASFENFPASDLARALRYVRANARPEASLLHVSHLSLAEHVALEDKIEPMARGNDEPTGLHAQHFIRCIRDGETPRCDALVGHRGGNLCHLSNISYKVGRRLKWDPIKEVITGDAEASQLMGKKARKPWDMITT